MKLGFLTWCFPEMEFKEILKWAHEIGFNCLGLSTWPEDLSKVKDLLEKYEIEASVLGACLNYLTPDLAEREKHITQLKKTIDDARELKISTVDIFAGRDSSKTIEDNLPSFKKVFTPLVKYAEDKGVKLAIENCPMLKWPSGTNIAISPSVWEKIFNLIPSDILGLCFDPSHFIWQGIDYIKAMKKFGTKIFHVHAKDAEVLKDKLAIEGIFGEGWWRDRIPGWGEVDWQAFITALRKVGYNGGINIEHEDKIFGFGKSEEEVKEGLLLGFNYLKPLII